MPVIKSHLLRNKARLISAGVKDKGDAHANKTCSIRCSCSAHYRAARESKWSLIKDKRR